MSSYNQDISLQYHRNSLPNQSSHQMIQLEDSSYDRFPEELTMHPSIRRIITMVRAPSSKTPGICLHPCRAKSEEMQRSRFLDPVRKTFKSDLDAHYPDPNMLSALLISGLTPEAKKIISQLRASGTQRKKSSSYNGQVDMTFHQLVYDVSSTHGAPPTVITKPGSEYAQKKFKLIYERVKSINFYKKNLKELFRKAVRLIIYQRNLLEMIMSRCTDDYLEVKAMQEFLHHHYKKSPFNKNDFRKRSHAKMSRHMMYALQKEPEDRTPKEVEQIKESMPHMNIQMMLNLMEGRSQTARKDFAKLIRFNRVTPGKIIVRQGHQTTGIYLLIKGEVLVFHTTFDKEKGCAVANLMALETDGYDFGVGTDGLRDFRPYTVVSKDTCDIAWIDKDDYQEFLKTVGETDRIKSREFILKVFPTSSVIEEESLEFLLNHCVYQEYPPGTVIPVKEFVGRRGMPKYIFIVYDGECLQYRHLHLLQRKDRFGNTIIRLDKNQHKQQQEQQAERPSTSQDPRQSILIAQSERWSLHPGNYSPREGVQFIQPALESVLDVQGHQTKSPLRRLEKNRQSWPPQVNKLFDCADCECSDISEASDEGQGNSNYSSFLPPIKNTDAKGKGYGRRSSKPSTEAQCKKGLIPNMIGPTGYFGTGEISSNTSFHTPPNKSTEFLVIPRDALESKMTLKHQLHMMTDKLDYQRVASPDLYSDYKLKHEWEDYKKNTVHEIITRPKNQRKRGGQMPDIRAGKLPITKYW